MSALLWMVGRVGVRVHRRDLMTCVETGLRLCGSVVSVATRGTSRCSDG